MQRNFQLYSIFLSTDFQNLHQYIFLIPVFYLIESNCHCIGTVTVTVLPVLHFFNFSTQKTIKIWNNQYFSVMMIWRAMYSLPQSKRQLKRVIIGKVLNFNNDWCLLFLLQRDSR